MIWVLRFCVLALWMLVGISPAYAQHKNLSVPPQEIVQTPPVVAPTAPVQTSKPETMLALTPLKVAILLQPADGAALLHPLIDAAEFALFESKAPVTLMPVMLSADTEEIDADLTRVLNRKPDMIIATTEPVAAALNTRKDITIPQMLLSRDIRFAASNRFVLGFHRYSTMQRLMDYTLRQDLNSCIAVLQDSAEGRAAGDAYLDAFERYGTAPISLQYYGSKGVTLGDALAATGMLEGNDQLCILTLEPYSVLDQLREQWQNKPPSQLLFLTSESAWIEVPKNKRAKPDMRIWRALQDSSQWDSFREHYKKQFGREPSVDEALIYDAVTLSALLTHSPAPLTHQSFINPRGYQGVLGSFKLEPDGTVTRDFSIQETSGSGTRILEKSN